MASLPNVPELRCFLVTPTSMVPGWKIWCKTLRMLGIRTVRWRKSAKTFNEMLESSKCPLHEHTELCQLDAISQIMALKAQFNLGRECYDMMMTVFERFLPKGPGPNYPGKNMNVYMQPLKDELQEAWDNGFKTYNAFRKRELQNACLVHVLDA